jgi:hypothetical protein
MEHDVGLGDAANQSTRAEVINDRKSLSVHFQKLFESCPHALVWRDPREIFIHEIRRNHHPGEFRLIEKLFDVVQRDGAEKLFIFPDDVDILQPVLHECIRNLSEGRIVRERDWVASNKIYYFRVGQLLVEECRSFAFERFSVNESLFENAAAVGFWCKFY